MNEMKKDLEVPPMSIEKKSHDSIPLPNSAVDDSSLQSRTVKSEDLFAGSREIWILHGQEKYRLMITRNGKLILQK